MLHDLASNNKHSHGVEGSETKRYFSTTVFCWSVFTVTVASCAPKASWVVVMYTMNNHTTRYDSVTAGLTKHCI